MKLLIKASTSSNSASDYVEDSMFRNYTPDKAAQRILDNVDTSSIESNLSTWISRQKQYGNKADSEFGAAVLNILKDSI